MEKFNTAMTVLMIVIMLIQLIINIAMLSKRSADAIKKLIARWAVPVLIIVMFSEGIFFITRFLIVDNPSKKDFIALAGGFAAISMAYAFFFDWGLKRRIRELERYYRAISEYMVHSSEPSDEGSNG